MMQQQSVDEVMNRSAGDPEESEDEMMGFNSFRRSVGARGRGMSVPSASSKQPLPAGSPWPPNKRPRADFDLESVMSEAEGEREPVQEPLRTAKQGKRAAAARGPDATDADAPVMDPAALKAKTTFETQKKAFTDAALWDSKTKLRAVERMGKTLETAVEKMLRSEGSESPASAALVEEMLQFAEVSKKKFGFFVEVRKGLEWARQAVSDEHLQLLLQTSPSVVATIFMHIAQQMLKKMDQVGSQWVRRVRCLAGYMVRHVCRFVSRAAADLDVRTSVRLLTSLSCSACGSTWVSRSSASRSTRKSFRL